MASRRRTVYQETSSSDENSDTRSDTTYLPKRRMKSNMADVIPQEVVKKRGRGPSKRPCLNRNAQMARENRQKKKEYVQKIENKLVQLQHENKDLLKIIQQQNIAIKKLNADASYLRSVLRNNSSITMLLKSINENLQRFKRKKEEEPTPLGNHRVTFANFESSERKDLGIETKAVRETNNVNNHGLTQTYRINNIKTNDEDQSSDNTRQEEKFENFLPVTPLSMDSKSEIAIDDANLNEFSNLPSTNIFDDLTPLDDVSNGVDFGQDDLPLLDDNFLQDLDENSGICFHVNPNRVSLEFCSSCQMNSANSALE